MTRSSKKPAAGRGEAGLPAEPRPAAAGKGAGRRYGAEERKLLLEDLERSGESMKAFCARHGLSTATVCKWRRALRERGEAGLAPREPRRNASGKTGRKRSPEERRLAVETFERSGLELEAFARTFGVSPWTLRGWLARYRAEGPKGLEDRKAGPAPGTGGAKRKVPRAVREEIARTKRRFPDFGLKRIRDFLARFQGTRVSTGTVARALREQGIERAVPASKPKRKKPEPRRFERARPGELWQSDITSFVLSRTRTRVYLAAFVDDHSRYIVSHALATQQRAELVIEALLEACARYGKPREVLTDQGRQYFAWRGKAQFQRVLEREGIRHVVARTHHPETLGKCERLWETIGREFWERARPQDLAEARERLAHFVAHYNFFRPHQGIDGLVPADRFFAAQEALRTTLEARLVPDELDLALSEAPRKGVYLFGQIGDEQVSLVGEKGRLVVHTSTGVRQGIGLEELGAPQAATETNDGNGRDDDRRISEAGAQAPDGQEAPGIQAAAALPARSEGALDEREPTGAGAGAPGVHADPRPVARQAPERGGGGGALAPATARVAALAAGPVGDAGGAVAPAQAATQEGERDDGVLGGRPAGAEAEDPAARAGARGQPEPDPALEPAPQAHAWGAGVDELDAGGDQNAHAPSEGAR